MTRTALLASTALTFISITPLVAQSAECIASGANLVCIDAVNQPFASEDAEASIVILSEASVVSADIEVPAIVISGDDTTMTNRGLVEQSNPEDDGHAITGSSDGITIINRGRIASGDRGIEMLGGSNLNVTNQSGATISTRGQGVRAGTESPGAVVENAGTITSSEDRALQVRSFGARVINNGDLFGAKEVVEARGGFYLENHGTIALHDLSIEDEDGVQLSGGEVQNYGSITGSDDGVDLDEGVVVNHAGGLIKSTAPDTNNNGGVDLDEVYDDGVSNERLPTGVTIINDGTIEGPKGINTDPAVVTSMDLMNRGVLNGRGGIAIGLAPEMGDSTVTIEGASEIYGDVLFGSGDDTVYIRDITSGALSTGLFNGGPGNNTVEFGIPLANIEAFRVEGDRVDLAFSANGTTLQGSFVSFGNWLVDGQSYDAVSLASVINNVSGLPGADEAVVAAVDESIKVPLPADLTLVGSDNIGEDLLPLVLEEFAEVLGASSVGSPIEFPDDVAQYIFTYEDGNEFVLEIESTSSGPGIERLIEGTADIAMSSRQANPEEIAAIARQGRGNLLDVSQEYILGVDSVLITVNPDNPIEELSRQQLAAIYNGDINNWSDVGGPNLPILPAARVDGSARDNFEAWAYDETPELGPQITLVDGGSAMRAFVASDPGAIGYSISDNVGIGKPVDLILDCGVLTEATPFKSKSEEYLLGRRIRLYIDNENTNPFARQFAEMMISPTVDQYVDESGYFALSIAEDGNAFDRLIDAALIDQPTAVGQAAQAGISDQLADATRLSMTFRFATNTSALDSKALRDLDRLVNYMSRPENASREFIFVGFADSFGEYNYNRGLSQNRANAVLQQARNHPNANAFADVNLAATGFGEAAPVSCNEEEQGRSRNRRVEIWVR